jgi:hypothetical protein
MILPTGRIPCRRSALSSDAKDSATTAGGSVIGARNSSRAHNLASLSQAVEGKEGH